MVHLADRFAHVPNFSDSKQVYLSPRTDTYYPEYYLLQFELRIMIAVGDTFSFD